jgi:hypothetical protein
MKQRITLSIALVMSLVLISLIGSATTANAAPPQRYVADTGTVTLGPNQILRLTVVSNPGGRLPAEDISLNFTVLKYQHGACNDSSVCMHTILSQTTTDPVTVRRGESASIDITQTPNGSAVRGLVNLNTDNAEINMYLVDTNTGSAILVGMLLPAVQKVRAS